MNDMSSAPATWWWAAEPAHCWGPAGQDLPTVAPQAQVRGRHWWPCDRTTRAGDRAVIVVTRGGTTVTYLADVLSDAREPRPWELSARLTLYVCDYAVHARVDGDPPASGRSPRVRVPGAVAGVMAG